MLALAPVGAGIAVTGCANNNPERIAYNSIYSVAQGGRTAYRIYIGQVISGQVKTNDVPRVSAAYDALQNSVLLAAQLAKGNTNAIAPSFLEENSQAFLNLVNSATYATTPK